MDLRFEAGLIDTEVTRSVVAGVTEGSVLPNSPRLTLNGRMKYEWSLSDRTMADITLSGNYQSRVRFDIVRSPAEAVEGGYVLANGEVGISFADHWRAAVGARCHPRKHQRSN